MTETTCPQCGRTADGSFCSWCGAALDARHCNRCGAELEPGARFCNRCGTALADGTEVAAAGGAPAAGGRSPKGRRARGGSSADGGGSGQLGWWVAGGAMVALILIIAYPVIRQDAVGPDESMAPAAGSGSGAAPGAGPSAIDISSMSPREAADQLFERVMRASTAGDSGQVAGFLPMSIQAYERARPLDADGLFHLALLRQTGGDFEGALATAREALEENPDHLLNLAAAAQAAHVMGDDETARGYYRRLLDVWDEERAADRPEYTLHEGLMPGMRQEARDFLGR